MAPLRAVMIAGRVRMRDKSGTYGFEQTLKSVVGRVGKTTSATLATA